MNQSPNLSLNPVSQTDFWEIEFPEAALKAEEYIYNFPEEVKDQSALTIALINNYLSWDEYAIWFMTKYQCLQIRTNLTLTDLLQVNQIYLRNRSDEELKTSLNNSKYKNMFKLCTWNEKNIIIGITYEFNLKQNSNDIFVLCKPHYLNFIQQNQYTFDSQSEFWNQKINSYKQNEYKTRQLFEAFCILKIEDLKTTCVYMDEELEKEISSPDVFSIDLSTDSFLNNYVSMPPLKPNDETPLLIDCELESFKVLDYSSAEIHKITEAGVIVGFFIGFRLQKALDQAG
jgi:hypothetical protein